MNVFVATTHISMPQSSHLHKCVCGDESCLYASVVSHINVFVVTRRVSMHTPGLTHMNVFYDDESCLYAYVISHMNAVLATTPFSMRESSHTS